MLNNLPSKPEVPEQVWENMNCLKFLSLLFKVSIFAGFLYQVSYLSRHYFAYETTSHFIMNENDDRNIFAASTIPKLAVCFPYTDILNMSKFEAKYNPAPDQMKESQYIHYLQSKVTVEDIFDMTPSEYDSISGCYYRSKDGLKYTKYEWLRKCQSIFRVRRFYSGEFMCYTYDSRDHHAFPVQAVAITMNSPSFMFGLKMTGSLVNANSTFFVVYDSDYPHTSMLYGVFFAMIRHNGRYEGVTVRYNWILSELLPPPYDTMCIQNTSECLTKCYAPVEKLLDREFNTNIVPFPSKRHHLSHADLRNETVQQIVSEAEKRCIDGCTERGCHLSFTVTIADHTWLADPDPQPVLYIHVKTPQHPDVQVTAIARWDLMSFLIYLCNCFSTWFGIDFLFILNIRTARFKMTKRRRKPDRRRLTVAERRQQTGRLQLPWYCGQSQRRTVPPITDTSL